MGIHIRECEAKDFNQFGVSDTLEEFWGLSWPDIGMLDTMLKGGM